MNLIGSQEGRKRLRHAVERRVRSAGSLAFRAFDIFPSRDHLVGIHRGRICRPISKYVGVPSNQFVGQLLKHILDGKAARLCSNLTMKEHLQQHIAQFFWKFGAILPVENFMHSSI